MIPKIIHYCWFGGAELPEMERRCIASWKHFMPDCEIRRWDETNFDLSDCPFARDAYAAGKWAFVSDWVHCVVLEKFGGIALDTDVEFLKPFDSFLSEKVFLGFSRSDCMAAPGLVFGSEPHSPLSKDLIAVYRDLDFIPSDGRVCPITSPRILTDILCERYGFKAVDELQRLNGVTVYPSSYFDPYNPKTGLQYISDDTHSIHHCAASWADPAKRYRLELRKRLGPVIGGKLSWILSSAASILKYGKRAF